jgi:hypothetical protein
MGSGLDGVSQSTFKFNLKTFVGRRGRGLEGRGGGRGEWKIVVVFLGCGSGWWSSQAVVVTDGLEI